MHVEKETEGNQSIESEPLSIDSESHKPRNVSPQTSIPQGPEETKGKINTSLLENTEY